MKRKRTLTEEDVYEANSGLVREVCRNYGKRIEHEDREAIANMGMIYAIRTYRRGVSSFESYAVSCMQELLWFAEDEQRSVSRVEHPLSLDMQLKQGESSTSYVEMIAHPNNDYTFSIIITDFIKKLEKNLQHVAYLYLNNYTTEEIAEHILIPVAEVERLRTDISYRWKEYDQ